MKIQILISKSSWANNFKIFIKRKLKKFSKNIKILDHHIKLKKNYDINIIFSYFKKIPGNFLKKSKFNLVPHESNLPIGKGMSPLTWQILENKKHIIFSLVEASTKIDSGRIYYQKKVKIPKHFIFKEIKNTQLKQNLLLIEKFLNFYRKNQKTPLNKIKSGKSTYYKKRKAKDSELNVNLSIKDQFNLLRVCDSENYPAFFKIQGKKYILKINKL